MIASALAGRPVAVAELQAGEPSWTDGQTIYVDGSARAGERVETLKAIAVQASLIAAGSLDPKMGTSQPRVAKIALLDRPLRGPGQACGEGAKRGQG